MAVFNQKALATLVTTHIRILFLYGFILPFLYVTILITLPYKINVNALYRVKIEN